MHLEVEQIQRLLHGELDAPGREVVQGHLEACADCRQQAAAAQREEALVLELLRLVDHAPPAVHAEALAARARQGSPRRFRWAAGVLLSLAVAGAAYAAPGSPLPAWVDRLVARVAGPAPVQIDPGPAGVAVEPGERFTIGFEAEQERGIVAVSLTDGASIVARRLAGTATFTTDVDRLVIANAGSTADYEIELPRGAAWVEIRLGARRLLLKDGQRVVADAPVDARGRYLLPLR
ncbi:MAG: zf-HC2 domain-containing protein [Gemmatimonadales bacterium]